MLWVPQVKAEPAEAQLPPRTAIVEDATIAVELGPISNLMVVQSPRVAEAVRELLAEVRIADHLFNDRLEEVGPFSFDVDTPPTPFGAPTLIVTARQDDLCGYRHASNLRDHYPRATFPALARPGPFRNIHHPPLCHPPIP